MAADGYRPSLARPCGHWRMTRCHDAGCRFSVASASCVGLLTEHRRKRLPTLTRHWQGRSTRTRARVPPPVRRRNAPLPLHTTGLLRAALFGTSKPANRRGSPLRTPRARRAAVAPLVAPTHRSYATSAGRTSELDSARQQARRGVRPASEAVPARVGPSAAADRSRFVSSAPAPRVARARRTRRSPCRRRPPRRPR